MFSTHFFLPLYLPPKAIQKQMDHGGEATDKEYNKGRKCFEGTSHFEPLQLKFHLLLNPGAFPPTLPDSSLFAFSKFSLTSKFVLI